MKVKDAFTIGAARNEVWELFQNPDQLAAWMPGMKSMKALSDTEYEAEMEVGTRFMTVSFQAVGRIRERVEGEKMLVEIEGTPMKLAGLFRATMDLRFREVDREKTEIGYELDLSMTGRLASLGDVLLKGVVVKSAAEFADKVREHFAQRTTAGQ